MPDAELNKPHVREKRNFVPNATNPVLLLNNRISHDDYAFLRHTGKGRPRSKE